MITYQLAEQRSRKDGGDGRQPESASGLGFAHSGLFLITL